MRAVKDGNGITTFISRDETRLFNKMDMEHFLDLNTLSERDHHLAEEMHKRNVVQKVQKDNKVGYKVYPQKHKL